MNAYEVNARWKKVLKITDYIAGCVGEPLNEDAIACLEGLDQTGRNFVAEAAGAKSPSETTWALVLDELRRASKLASVDPFARFDTEAA